MQSLRLRTPLAILGPRPTSPCIEDRRTLERFHRPLVVIDRLEALIHYVVAALLLAIAGIVLWRTIVDLVAPNGSFASEVVTAINDVLFVVILMELLRTVVGHLETDDFRLRSFLIIGIVSAVRHILAVGARLTLSGDTSAADFQRSQVELAVSAGVVLALAIGYRLITRALASDR
jgi:uncharacterized membrane protein (DUF373 family)